MASILKIILFVSMNGLILIGCNSETDQEPLQTTKLPEHVQNLENVSVFSVKEQLANADTVELIRETVFESNEDVFMVGYTGEVAIDDQNRVYIVSSIPGTAHVYVFEPNGEFIAKFFREGRGIYKKASIEL